MSTLELRQLRPDDEESFRRAVREFEEDPQGVPFAFDYDPAEEFEPYMRRVNAWSLGEGLPEGFVPNSFLVGVVGERIVGRLSLRHELNEDLKAYNGHIGYAVIHSERRKGYATDMLKQSLVLCRELGIHRVLISCDTDNLASRRVIEKQGGVLERITELPELEVQKRVYWINVL